MITAFLRIGLLLSLICITAVAAPSVSTVPTTMTVDWLLAWADSQLANNGGAKLTPVDLDKALAVVVASFDQPKSQEVAKKILASAATARGTFADAPFRACSKVKAMNSSLSCVQGMLATRLIAAAKEKPELLSKWSAAMEASAAQSTPIPLTLAKVEQFVPYGPLVTAMSASGRNKDVRLLIEKFCKKETESACQILMVQLAHQPQFFDKTVSSDAVVGPLERLNARAKFIDQSKIDALRVQSLDPVAIQEVTKQREANRSVGTVSGTLQSGTLQQQSDTSNVKLSDLPLVDTYYYATLASMSGGTLLVQAYVERNAEKPFRIERESVAGDALVHHVYYILNKLNPLFVEVAQDAKIPLLQKRLFPKMLPGMNVGRDLIEVTRQDAIRLCDHDRSYCQTRFRIHGSPSEADIADTKKFLDGYKKSGDREGERLAQASYDNLVEVYHGRGFEKGLDFAGGSSLLKSYNDLKTDDERLKFVSDQGLNLMKGALTDKKVLLLNALLEKQFVLTGAIIQKSDFTKMGRVPLGDLLKSIYRGLYCEGLISEKDMKDAIQQWDLGATSTESIKKIVDSAMAQVRTQFQKTENAIATVKPEAKHFSEEILRSSLMLHLGQISDKLPASMQTYRAYQEGVICGQVKVIRDVKDIVNVPTGINDILVFMKGVPIPTDLGVFGAVITEEPQGEMSHVVLKGRNRGSPDAFDVKAIERFKDLDQKAVQIKVGPEGLEVQPVDISKLNQPATHRPLIKPERDLTVTKIQRLDAETLSRPDMVKAIGTKAFNYGHLHELMGDEAVRPGAAIPFSFYNNFMNTNGLALDVQRLSTDPKMKTDAAYRAQQLKVMQEKILSTPIDPKVLTDIQTNLQAQFGTAARVRFRSSSNSEDLPGFNGAGLYDSYSGNLNDLKSIEKALRKTWSSVWNDRAYAERAYFNIDHGSVAMGALVHESYQKEQANGVGLTGDNVMRAEIQHDEISVTNPETTQTNDVVRMDLTEPAKPVYNFTSRTNLKEGADTLTPQQLTELGEKMQRLHDYFKYDVYHEYDNAGFTMDIEFKLVAGPDGKSRIMIKQARPFKAQQ